MSDNDNRRLDLQWNVLYNSINAITKEYGVEDAEGKGDFWQIDDNYGNYEHHLYLFKIRLLKTPIIERIYCLIAETLREWNVAVHIDAPDAPTCPPMGVYISSQGLSDELDRKCLPREFQQLPFDHLPKFDRLSGITK